MEWKRIRRRFISRTPFFYCVLSTCLLLTISVLLLCTIRSRTVRLDILSSSLKDSHGYIKGTEKSTKKSGEKEVISSSRSISRRNWFNTLRTSRRHLNGLGSYPPRCTSKCGRCTPCKPVHVPVPPGTSAPTEYYPEAWRCKCGNKLYMP